MQKEDSTTQEGLLAGLDEVGRGALAGPLCIVVAAFPASAQKIPGVDDSKKLKPKTREALAPVIFAQAAYIGIGWAHPRVIDELGIEEAWRRAALDALENAPPLAHLYVDGDAPVAGYLKEQTTIVKGDSLIWQISAASVAAKVIRDKEMTSIGEHYPVYNWKKNSGYGVEEHRKALMAHGPCWYHRNIFLRKLYDAHKEQLTHPKWEEWAATWL